MGFPVKSVPERHQAIDVILTTDVILCEAKEAMAIWAPSLRSG